MKTKISQISESSATALKYLTTIAACLTFLAEGLVFTVPEPTLLALRDVTGSTIAAVSLIFSIRSAGGLIASLLTGFVQKNWGRDVLLGIITIVMSFACAVVPWCNNLPLMYTAFFVQGYGIGYIETNANVLIKDIWLDESAPVLQALYLSFLFGSFLVPLLEIPFLSRKLPEKVYLPKACSVLMNHIIPSQDIKLAEWCQEFQQDDQETDDIDPVSLKQFFVMVGGICAVIGILMLVFGYLCENYVIQGSHVGEDELVPNKQQSRCVTFAVLSLITISGGLFVGAELNYAGFLTAFVVLQLRGTNAQGIYVTSMYWGVYTVAAMFSIVVVKYLRASKVIFICSLTMTIGLVILVSGAQMPIVLWIGTAIFALGCSATYGGIFVLADEYITLTSAVSAVVVSGTTVGEFIVPLISGQLFERNPMSLMYLTFACILVSDVGFIIMEVIVRKLGTTYKDTDVNHELPTIREEKKSLLRSDSMELNFIDDQEESEPQPK